jgi:hypothetical protein
MNRKVPSFDRPTTRGARNAFRYTKGNQLEIIEAALKIHNPGISGYEIEEALNWAYEHLAKGLPKDKRTIDSTFTHPMRMVEFLITEARADRETILAAILYPAFCHGKDTLQIGMVPLDKRTFLDDRVCKLIERTLLFRAQNLPDLKPGGTQSRDEQIRLFRLMSLWATECDPRSILIRGLQLVYNLEKIIDDPDYFTTEEKRTILRTADQVYAQLTYIAGYGRLRSQIMDLSLRIQDPNEYNEIVDITKRRLGGTEVEQEANRKAIIRRIAESVEQTRGLLHGYHFEVEFRAKSPGSAHAKKIRKNKAILAKWREEHPDDQRSDDELKQSPELKDTIVTYENVGDLLAARIILKKPIIAAMAEEVDATGADKRSVQKRAGLFSAAANTIYDTLSYKYGRDNHELTHSRTVIQGKKVVGSERYSYRQEQFARFAVIDPANDDKLTLDDRKDNYYLNPKPDGYAAIHDTLFINISGRDLPIEIECQIVDEEQHDLNTRGPRRGHLYYKSGMVDHSMPIRDWRNNASAILSDRRPRKEAQVLVFDRIGQIVDITDNPTVEGFFKKIGIECVEALVTHPYYLSRQKGATCGPSTRLNNGSTVAPVLKAA